MDDRPTDARPQPTAQPPGVRASAAPSSSRMLTSYLSDIEQLLDEHRWDAALREARDLPSIAVALADPSLLCEGEQVQSWCSYWIRPPGAERDAHGLDFEHLGRRIAEQLAPRDEAGAVPARALRRLQLRRHVRTPPRGFSARRTRNLPPKDSEALEISTALLDAARRWYARSACHDATVQSNLARLAVLR
ncbi:MAG: hypothetical protein JO361_08205 [Gammaproteobacteria bacterium]|nr:hypothetical protein [Gammaproteobacteria bacterium]